MAQMMTYDGKTIKAIDFTPWGGIDGFLEATSGTTAANHDKLRGLVPWLQKGITMTGNAVAQLPYSVRDMNDDEIDPEIAWGAVRNPQMYIKLLADSLCGGAGYMAIKTTSRAIVSFQYLLASSMEPVFNGSGNVVEFKRRNGAKLLRMSPNDLIYCWLPDDTVETGPARVHPIRNALLPAQLIAGMDASLYQYSERGFIPPTLLAVKGMVTPDERSVVEKWWNAFLRGWTKTAAKVINAETVTPQVLGAGMDELRGTYSEITLRQIENIAAAFDIPLSLFMSNAANYATANADRKTWYETGTFVSIYQTIEDALNTQLFRRFDWRFKFEPEKLPAFQQEESDKSNAVSTMTSALASSPEEFVIVCDVLGIELSEEQEQDIKELIENKQPQPEQLHNTPQSDAGMDDISAEDEANEIAGEMMTWRKYALRHFGKQARAFETKSIPPMMTMHINSGLASAQSVEDIGRVFDQAGAGIPELVLASSINRLAAS